MPFEFFAKHNLTLKLLTAFAVVICLTAATPAQIGLWEAPTAPQVSIKPEPQLEIPAGQAAHLSVNIQIPSAYLLYSPAPRGKEVKPIALQISASVAGDIKAGETLYPKPVWHEVNLAGLKEDNLVYEHEFEVLIPLETKIANKSQSPQLKEVTIHLTGQLCDEKGCYPLNQSQNVIVTITPPSDILITRPAIEDYMTAVEMDSSLPQSPVKADGTKNSINPTAMTNTPGASMTTLAALAAALLAGIALNVMPCVLPVIPIKILSIIQQSGDSHRRRMQLGMAYAAGILSFFLLIGIASAGVRLAGAGAFNLNEPFKNPGFIIAMVMLLTAAAGWLFGAFTLFAGGMSMGSGQPKGGMSGSVVMGFFTALLATPCSGPVLAAVFGWAQWRGAGAGMAVFASLGIGMALPHGLLAAMPKLLDKLPKPGMWTERLRQSMGFVLLIVAAWLLSVLGDPAWIFKIATLAVILSACLWLGWTVTGFNVEKSKRTTVRVIVIAIFAAAAFLLGPKPSPSAIHWKSFDNDSINKAVAEGKVVIVKYTAQWCTLCKIVDIKVYKDTEVAAMLAEFETVNFKADVTWNDSAAEINLTETLAEPGPPLTLVYGPGSEEPIRLRGVFTKQQLTEAIEQMR